MPKIRILLYRTVWKLKLKYFFNWLISIRTLSKWSHIELWEPDSGTPMLWYDYYEFTGECYTSTMRDEANGTVKRDASEVLIHPENWSYIEIEINETDYKMMMDYMENEVYLNQGYSKWDILKFISPVHFADNKRNICSEFVNNALFFACVFEIKGIVSPAKVAKKLTKLGYETKPLKE